jgi:hypothetical protein
VLRIKISLPLPPKIADASNVEPCCGGEKKNIGEKNHFGLFTRLRMLGGGKATEKKGRKLTAGKILNS